ERKTPEVISGGQDASVPAAKPVTAINATPKDKVSSAALCVTAAGVPAKLTSDELDEFIARASNATLSPRQLAKLTGWSHQTIWRRLAKARQRAEWHASRISRME